MTGGIFISYRRDDAKHAAGRLVDRLAQTFSTDQLFLDIDNIEPGLDFKKVLSDKVQACDVLLAIIGPGWLAAADETGSRRLENPKDFVRIEIEAALARDVRVIPVLVDGAPMPSEEELPGALQPLANRNAVRLEHTRFGADAESLTKALTKVVVPVKKRADWAQTPQAPRDRPKVVSENASLATPEKRGTAGPIAFAALFAVVAPLVALASTTGPVAEIVVIVLWGEFLFTLAAALVVARIRGDRLTGVEAALLWLGCSLVLVWPVAASVGFPQWIAWGDSSLKYFLPGFALGALLACVAGLGLLYAWRRR